VLACDARRPRRLGGPARRRGRECWLGDWPGTGRSGNRNGLEIEYDDVVDGFRRLLRDVIARPVVVVCHSMGGAVTWQLVQDDGDLVAGVVAVAAAYPANVVARSEVVSDDGNVAVIDFADTGVRMVVDRRVMNLYGDGYIYQQAIATSTRFPEGYVDALRAGLVGLPPRMLLQRLGVLEGMPVVDRPEGFLGKPIRLLTGGEDPAHTREIEERTVSLLRGWGADAELVWLPDLGIEGNGHFLMFEENSDEILDVLVEQIETVSRAPAPD
jgi:pimeloyl-ACP methyl ester carboxylesterase